jgi:murein DD-endopeptidase MepM/ murein hydrolase activator NlpD
MRRVLLFSIITVLLAVWVVPVTASELSKAKEQKNYIDNKLNSITKQKQKEKEKLKSAISEKEQLVSAQKREDEEYKRLKKESEELEKEVDAIKTELDDTIDKYKEKEELFKTRIRVMYEKSGSGYLNTLAKSGNASDFLARLKYIKVITEKDKELIDEIKTIKTDIEYKKRLREALMLDKQKKLEDKKEKLDSLQASRADLEGQIRESQSKLEELEKQEDQFLKESQAMANKIRSLQSKGNYIGGKLMWPTPSTRQISSYYGNRMHPILKKYKMHTGIDIAASYGASIVAANKGTVIVAGWQSGYGNTVIIDHGGGITTLYAHCSRLLVSVGDSVNAGAVIAKVGSTGLSTGPHLHFEVRKNGSTQDPLNYVK